MSYWEIFQFIGKRYDEIMKEMILQYSQQRHHGSGWVIQLVSVVLIHQACRFDLWSRLIQEAPNDCISKWNNKSIHISLKSIKIETPNHWCYFPSCSYNLKQSHSWGLECTLKFWFVVLILRCLKEGSFSRPCHCRLLTGQKWDCVLSLMATIFSDQPI